MKVVQKIIPKNQTNFSDFAGLPASLPKRSSKVVAVFEVLRDLIVQGELPVGSRLPASRVLAKRFSVSRSSVVAAFEMLIAEGFATAQRGAGTFVSAVILKHKNNNENQTTFFEDHEPGIGSLGLSVPDRRSWEIFRKLMGNCSRRSDPKYYYSVNPLGGQRLREAIALYLKSTRGVQCAPEQILITSGTQQSLDLVSRALFSEKQTVIMESPGYSRAYALFHHAGHKVVSVGVDNEGIDISEVEKLSGRNAALFVTPSHQFPTGVIMSMKRRLALIAWAEKNSGLILEDDHDGEFRFEGPPLTALQGLDLNGRVIYLGSFSKILFPSVRVGYVVLPMRFVEKVAALRTHVDRHDTTIEEEALAEFIFKGHLAAHLRRVRKKAAQCRNALLSGLLKGSNGLLQYTPPMQGLHLVIPLPAHTPDENVVRDLQKIGITSHKLSERFFMPPKENGLIVGFSGFPQEAFYRAGVDIGRVIAGYDFAAGFLLNDMKGQDIPAKSEKARRGEHRDGNNNSG